MDSRSWAANGTGLIFIPKLIEDMTKELKDLLALMAADRYTVEDCENIIMSLAKFARAKRHLQNSQTPEGESLARWEIQDAEEDWTQTCLVYTLPYWEPRRLIE